MRSEPRRRVGPKHKIVHVAHVTRHPQTLLHEPVERAEIRVGEMLRGQTPNRQPPAWGHREAANDPVKQAEQSWILDQTIETTIQNIVRHAVEVSSDIELEEERMTRGKLSRPIERGQMSFPLAAGERGNTAKSSALSTSR